MLSLRALILTAALAACGPSQPAPVPRPAPTPRLCAAICSSNTECRSAITLCRFCNFGTCSQTAPQITVQLLVWIEDRIRKQSDATTSAGADAIMLLDDLIAKARRTADDAAALDAIH